MMVMGSDVALLRVVDKLRGNYAAEMVMNLIGDVIGYACLLKLVDWRSRK